MTEHETQTPLDQALEWCVRLHDAGTTQAEREAFACWLAADTLHPPAWARAQQVWGAAGAAGQAYAAKGAPRRRMPRRYRVGLASAAMLLLAVATLMFAPARWAGYRTEVAQVRSWTLEDGSTVQLAPQTALDVKFTDGERRIRLYRGEAWFKVAANPARPFIVQAADGQVRALGTAFDVRVAEAGADVTVTEHSVRLSYNGHQVDARQGQALHYGAGGIGPLRSVNLGQQLAWREQRLAFSDATLAQVIERLQPYSNARLVLADAKLAHLRVTAAMQAGDADAALQSLQVILPIRVSHIGPWLTLVRAAER